MPKPDTSSQNLLFDAFGLQYNKISKGYDQLTNQTLKKVRAFSCLSW